MKNQWKSYSAESIDLGDMQALLKPVAKGAQFKQEPQRKRMMIWATAEEHQKISTTLSAFQGTNDAEFKDVLILSKHMIHKTRYEWIF